MKKPKVQTGLELELYKMMQSYQLASIMSSEGKIYIQPFLKQYESLNKKISNCDCIIMTPIALRLFGAYQSAYNSLSKKE